MARVGDRSDVPITLLPASSLNVGSPVGYTPDLEGTGIRSIMMEEKQKCSHISRSCHCSCLPGHRPFVLQKSQMLKNCQQLRSTCCRTGNNFSFRFLRFRLGKLLEFDCDGSTATESLGSHGPGTSDSSRNIRR